MTDPSNSTVPNTSSESMPTSATEILADAAAVAAKLSVDASVTAQQVIATAAEVALHEKERQVSEREKMGEIFVESLNKVFGEKVEQEQFINVSRIPFLCIQVREIHTQLEKIVLTLEELKFVKKFLYAIGGIFGSAVVVAFGILLTHFLKK